MSIASDCLRGILATALVASLGWLIACNRANPNEAGHSPRHANGPGIDEQSDSTSEKGFRHPTITAPNEAEEDVSAKSRDSEGHEHGDSRFDEEAPRMLATDVVECGYVLEFHFREGAEREQKMGCCWPGQEFVRADEEFICVGQPDCPQHFHPIEGECELTDAQRVRLLEKCEGGDGPACLTAGRVYRDGIGVTEDIPRANKLLNRACELKETRACVEFVRLRVEAPNRPPNKPFLLGRIQFPGCDRGDVSICREIYGLIMATTAELRQDVPEFLEYLDFACGTDSVGCTDRQVLRALSKEWRSSE